MEDQGLKQQFGKRVQHQRKAKKLTQEQLAEATDLSVDTISNIERGLSSTRIETIGSLANALSISLAELFEFAGSPTAKRADLKQVHKLIEMITQCPPDQLPALTKIVEQALTLSRPK